MDKRKRLGWKEEKDKMDKGEGQNGQKKKMGWIKEKVRLDRKKRWDG